MLVASSCIIALASGALLWSLVEYVTHRWSMHGAIGPAVVEVGHGRHHGDPRLRPLASPLTVVAVTTMGLTAVPVAGAFVALALGLPWWAGALAGPGLILGYTVYERLHFGSHFHAPRTRYGRWAQRRHLHHHDADDRTNFCMTVSIWDRLFGTYQSVPRPVAGVVAQPEP